MKNYQSTFRKKYPTILFINHIIFKANKNILKYKEIQKKYQIGPNYFIFSSIFKLEKITQFKDKEKRTHVKFTLINKKKYQIYFENVQITFSKRTII